MVFILFQRTKKRKKKWHLKHTHRDTGRHVHFFFIRYFSWAPGLFSINVVIKIHSGKNKYKKTTTTTSKQAKKKKKKKTKKNPGIKNIPSPCNISRRYWNRSLVRSFSAYDDDDDIKWDFMRDIIFIYLYFFFYFIIIGSSSSSSSHHIGNRRI